MAPHPASGRPSRQQELPQDDELLLHDDELLEQDDELLPQDDELLEQEEEPDPEPSQASPAAYQDEQLNEAPAAPVADAAPVPLLEGPQVRFPCPLPQPYPDACRPRSSQARRQARRTSHVHSTAAPSTAAATTTAVTIVSPFHRARRPGCRDHARRIGGFNRPLSKPRGSSALPDDRRGPVGRAAPTRVLEGAV